MPFVRSDLANRASCKLEASLKHFDIEPHCGRRLPGLEAVGFCFDLCSQLQVERRRQSEPLEERNVVLLLVGLPVEENDREACAQGLGLMTGRMHDNTTPEE